jgi:uncharacterized cupredoxin-like copper-binding protein
MTLRAARIAPLVAALALAACGGGAAAPGQAVNVTERDFAIAAPSVLQPGQVTFRVRNEGPVAHELIVVRAPRGELPFRSDGITADEELLEPITVGALEPGPAGSVRTLTVDLKPGTYQLFCNMNGHYRGGMHVELEVP